MKVYYGENGVPIRIGSFGLSEVLYLLTTMNYGLKRHSFLKLEWHRIAYHMGVSESALRSLFAHLTYCYNYNLPYFGAFREVPLNIPAMYNAHAVPDVQLQQANAIPVTVPNFAINVPQSIYFSRRGSFSAQERLLIFALKIHHMDFEAVRARFFANTDIEVLMRQYETLRDRAASENGISAEQAQAQMRHGLCEADVYFRLEKTIVNEEVLEKLSEIVGRQQ